MAFSKSKTNNLNNEENILKRDYFWFGFYM